MDDKNKEIIDFSNQPLGLMAQEGAQIEKKMDDEYRKNEAARNNAGTQDNPFADVTFGKKEEKPTVIMTVTDSNQVPNEQPPVETVPTTPVSEPTTPVTNPTPTPEPPVEEPTAPKAITEEERKQQILNELVQGSSAKGDVISNGQGDQPGSWGIMVFLILIGVVAVAAFLFKSGKLDSLLGKSDEDTNTQEVSEPKKEEEQQPVEEKPAQPIDIKNCDVKETIYISAGDTLSTTAQGTLDLENRKGKFIVTVSYNGLMSHNIDEYCDYNTGYCYYEDFEKANVWHKEAIDTKFLGPYETYDFVMMLGTPDSINKNTYTMEIQISDMFKMVENNDYVNTKKVNNGLIKIEYVMDNSILKRIKFNLTDVYNDKTVKQAILVKEFSNINKKTESITIPEDVINKAK